MRRCPREPAGRCQRSNSRPRSSPLSLSYVAAPVAGLKVTNGTAPACAVNEPPSVIAASATIAMASWTIRVRDFSNVKLESSLCYLRLSCESSCWG